MKNAVILSSGIVEFSSHADELELRWSIVEVMSNSEVAGCGPRDFEFVKRCGHSFRVPTVAPGFTFDFGALKTLVGQGDLYVRLPRPVASSQATDDVPSMEVTDDTQSSSQRPRASRSSSMPTPDTGQAAPSSSGLSLSLRRPRSSSSWSHHCRSHRQLLIHPSIAQFPDRHSHRQLLLRPAEAQAMLHLILLHSTAHSVST